MAALLYGLTFEKCPAVEIPTTVRAQGQGAQVSNCVDGQQSFRREDRGAIQETGGWS